MTATIAQPGDTVSVVGLRVERHDGHHLGVATPMPYLSWRTETRRRNWRQAAWELEALDVSGAPLWQPGRVESPESVLVAWGGEPLKSRTRCSWRVRVVGVDGSLSSWSPWAYFEVGLLHPHDWQAEMITPGWDDSRAEPRACPHLTKQFDIAEPRRARLHVTALGLYELRINGTLVGDHRLAPGWTAYRHRIHVQTFNVGDQLQRGQNRLEAVLADGWYRGHLGFLGQRNFYGDRVGLILQLEIEHEAGELLVVTDRSWLAAPGPTRSADIYDGEVHDARVVPGPWSAVDVIEFDRSRLVPAVVPPVRVIETRKPVAIDRRPSGRLVLDFGQNLVGVLRLRVSGQRGTTITVRHAEVLEHGELCTRILRTAKATDTYTLAGDGLEEWSPRFTFHGFRFAEVDGWPGELCVDDIEALVIHTDMRRTGWFHCSNALVDRLHENIVWSWRGNALSIPSDCPQRDERLGWTGDIQVFTATAAFLFDVSGFLDGWLRDLAADQLPDGRVPMTIPYAVPIIDAHPAGWGDAATIVPSTLHEWYADRPVVERQYESMRAWVESVERRASPTGLWTRGFQFGDWVDPTVDPHTPGAARTDAGFIATAYFARSAELVAAAAADSGRVDDAARFAALARRVRAGVRHEWVAPSGRVVPDTQAGCALALRFDLVEHGQRSTVAEQLRRLVRAEGYRLSTGFLGTPAVLPALSDAGFVNDAYRLLLQTRPPSWLYPVSSGATTMWERWDALQPDGSLNEAAEMLSFNHYALGAVGEWLHRCVGGLAALEPGFRRFLVGPQPGPGMASADIVFCSPYGTIEIHWALIGRGVDLHVVVPPNTQASIVLPGAGRATMTAGSGAHRWQYPVDPDVYRCWVPPEYGLDSALHNLIDTPAWAVVVRHLPEVAERYGHRVEDLTVREFVAERDEPWPGLDSLDADLAALTPVPPPPPAIDGDDLVAL